ncbi:lactate/malate family dehydrogenase [Arthrobacter silvisoli]|uniref:lactate/malate family dehydrogenase n=1 Tax=Arthrobacter silvisoli TaxID=2291022 RepID=UPI0014445644|nr:NAD-dependent epimerase/dehydratase family protein [Arthrobacter silvisoli]
MTEHLSTTEDTHIWPRSVVVIGAAGLIGSGVVERLAVEGLVDTVYMTDLRENVLQAHAIDVSETQILTGNTRTRLVVGPPAEGSGVDLVIVAASAPETPDGDRRDFLRANLELLRLLLPDVERLAGEQGIVMLLSNPVDILGEALRRLSGIGPDRIVGYSLNDSVRFRAAVGRELGIAPERIEGIVLGEHGDGQVPLFSALTLDGKPLELKSEQRARITADITGWFSRWSALKPGRSSGWTTPQGVAQVVKAMGTGAIHPATAWTGSIEGLPDSFVSMPTRFEKNRFVPTLGTLSESESAALAQAAKSVEAAAERALHDLRLSK